MSWVRVRLSRRRRLPVVAAGLLSAGAIAGAAPAAAGAIAGAPAGASGEAAGVPATAAGGQSLGPDALTDAPAHVTPSAATLRGSLIPGAATTSYEFQLGLSYTYGVSTVSASLAPSNLSTIVSAHVSDLRAGTIYHYRLVATSADGTSYGPDQTFLTPPAQPQRITVQVTPSDSLPPTYRYVVTGAMILPPGVSSEDGCDGYVSVEATRGRRPLVVEWATVDQQCRYRASVAVSADGPGDRRRFAIRVRFLGSRVLAAQVAAPVFVAVG